MRMFVYVFITLAPAVVVGVWAVREMMRVIHENRLSFPEDRHHPSYLAFRRKVGRVGATVLVYEIVMFFLYGEYMAL